MSGQQWGTVIGGVIGAYFGNPQLGMAIGGMIGGAVDPDVIKAPSIGDAQQQTANAGVPRPVVFGHPAPFSGNIIDGEPKARKIKVKTRQGKGGPIVISEKFLLTTAVRICEGPIAGVVRIWRNGEVVYDRRATEDLPTYEDAPTADVFKWQAEMRAKSNSFQNKVRIYLGTEDQLPDPALEAIHGVGNTPYYRGTAYMVITDDDVTDTRGAAAQYQFEVLAADAGADDPAPTLTPSEFPPPSVGIGGGITASWVEVQEFALDISAARGLLRFFATPSYDTPVCVRITSGGSVLYTTGWMGDPSYQGAFDTERASYTRLRRVVGGASIDNDAPAAIAAFMASVGGGIVGVGPLTSPAFEVPAGGFGTVLVEVIRPYVTGVSGGNVEAQFPDPALLPASVSITPESPDVLLGSDGVLYYPAWYSGPLLNTITPGSVTLSSVVASIASRCEVPASRIDLSALTDTIPGLLVAQQASGADCIRPTQQMFFFDMPEVDGQIVAVMRGGAAAATLTDDDLLETGDTEEITRPQQVEFPAKVSVVTQDPAAEYSPIPQTSIRTSPNITATNEVTIQSPIPFTATEAKRRADIIHKIMFCTAEGKREFALPEEFSRLVPSDCLLHNGKRWLIEQKDSEEGQHLFKCVYDRASSYSSVAIGTAPRPPALPSTGLRGPTTLAVMNLPSLRAQDSVPGVYMAATGTFTGWDGCLVQMSTDNGATYSDVVAISDRSVLGNLTADITASSEPVPVLLLDGELFDVTTEQIADRANGFALIGPGDVSEVGQFETATDTGTLTYDLTTVTRGVLRTTATSHVSGERFVMLGDVVFVPLDINLSGRTLLFRAVTNGTVPETNPVIAFVFNPLFTGPQVIETLTVGGENITVAGAPIYVVT